MKTKKAGRPLCLSPIQPGPKAELQVEDDWGGQAGGLLKEAMEKRGWGFRELSERLAIIGLEMKPPAVNRRINRGNFSAGFFLMSLEAMGVSFQLEIGESLPRQDVAKRLPGNKARIKKPVDGLEAIMEGWGAKKSPDKCQVRRFREP